MKKIILLLTFLTIGSLNLLAQGPPPNPPSSANSSGSYGYVGGTGGAPVGNGTFILLALAGVYGARKVYGTRESNFNSLT
ncbi:MAG: hypothetical protein ACOYN4_14160 [Bacteroidales bacterium]|jgi:hypothetical protein